MTARDVRLGSTIRTHREAVRAFFSRRSPWALRRLAIATWLSRAVFGPPGPRDLLAAATATAVWPVQEWVLHEYLLHLEPCTIGGVHVNPELARAHRKHHVNPRVIDTTLLPIRTIYQAMPFAAACWLLLFGPRRNHRLHHARHEGDWFDFTLPLVERVLGSDPDPGTIGKSPTAMDLHGLEQRA